jgi:glycosyltransferase involved in cell wall biosynthesis
MDKITVITIAYNAERTIKRAVDSVINQTFRDFDYTIVDHGSTDGTRLMIQEYERKDTRIHGVYLDANGVNNGDFDATIKLILEHMKVSRADYAVVLDSDDFYEKTALEHMLIFAEQNNCDVVCCGSNFVLERTGEVRGRRMMQSNVFLT